MRRIIAILGVLVLGTIGCKHVGGKCDCGSSPGDAALYAPMHGYAAPLKADPAVPAVEMPKK